MQSPYEQAARTFLPELARSLPTERLRELHRLSAGRHFLLVLQQLTLLAAAVWVILAWGDRWYAWIPASIAIGFVAFSFTVLLHEVVHGTVFATRRPRLSRVLGHCYAVPSGLSSSQFTRWHLDHHDNLGTEDLDPKRRYLSPKRVKRWFKALYVTPALFPIYFRAARKAAASYEPALVRRIRRERWAAMALHLGLPALLWATLGFEAALKLHLLPIFVVFPVLFTVNRLGQHYDVDPDDPAAWGTLMKRSPFLWDRLFLFSNYHLEHHYFTRVPCYRLPALRRLLDPFFEHRGIRPRTYGGLLWDWFGRNKVPHTRWQVPAAEASPSSRG
jgi:fatty acid desaturase